METNLPSNLRLLTKMPPKCCQRAGILSAAHEPELCNFAIYLTTANSVKHSSFPFKISVVNHEDFFYGCDLLNVVSGVWCRTAVGGVTGSVRLPAGLYHMDSRSAMRLRF